MFRFLSFLILLLPITLISQSLPEGFTIEWLETDWDLPIGMEFDAEGTMYVWEKGGKVWIIKDGEKLTTPLVDIHDEVGNYGDIGLLSFAQDPNFNENGYFYLFYTVDRYHLLNSESPLYDPEESINYNATIARVTRFQADAVNNFETTIEGSRHVLIGETITTGIPILHTSHGGGSLFFGDDGSLMVSTGDGATWYSPYTGGGPPFLDEYVLVGMEDGIIRPNEEVGSYRPQLVNNHNGKILRFDPATGDGIPSNPFYDAANPDSPQSRVWQLGLRNPYRACLRPGSGSTNMEDGLPGTVYVADVGAGGWEELNIARTGGHNFGWPSFEGMGKIDTFFNKSTFNKDAVNPLADTNGDCNPYFYFQDLLKQDASPAPEFFNPCDPSQEIPEGIQTFVHKRPDLAVSHYHDPTGFFMPDYDEDGNPIARRLDGSDASPVPYNSNGIRAGSMITGGFYNGNTFPEEYHNKFILAEYSLGWIRMLDMDLNDEIVGVKNLFEDTILITHVAANPVDGCIYLMDYPRGLKRICYGLNVPPQALAIADVNYGVGPLTVQFTGEDSFDPQGDSITYFWDFGDNNTSTEINPVHTFNAPANTPTAFTVTLKVTDEEGAVGEATVIISLNNTPPIVDITSIPDGYMYPVSGLSFLDLEASVTDAEHNGSELSYAWQVNFGHNTHEHAEPVDNTPVTSTIIFPSECSDEIYYYRISLSVTDGAGLVGYDERVIHPDCENDFVDLFSFSAQKNIDQVDCKWTTLSEQDVSHFVLERAGHDSDFEEIYQTDKMNFDETETNYLYEDIAPLRGLNTYRLSVVSNQGAVIFSDEQSVYFLSPDALLIAPNPANSFVQIIIGHLRGHADLEVFAANGQLIYQKEWQGNGLYTEWLDVSEWPSGLYFYKLKNGDDLEQSGRILVQR